MKNGIPNLWCRAGTRLIAAGLLAMVVCPASAGVVYTSGLGVGNAPLFDTATTGSSHSLTLNEVSTGLFIMLAEPFIVSADSTATDVLVPLSLLSNIAPFNNGAVVDFSIVSNAGSLPNTDLGGNPLSALYTGAATPITGTLATIYDVTLAGSATLTAGTTYWLMAKVPGVSPGTGCPANNCGFTSDKWYKNNLSTQPNGIVSYSGGQWASVTSSTLAFTIEGNAAGAVPEPGSFFLLAGGLMGTLLVSGVRCRQRAAAGIA